MVSSIAALFRGNGRRTACWLTLGAFAPSAWLAVPALLTPPVAWAQAAPAAPAAVSQRGTVKAISGNALTLTPDKGADIVITIGTGARIPQIAPGSTDLKTAQTIALTDIAAGDRVLVTGKPGEADAIVASRVILMKSTDIAEKRAAEEADWQKRGTGGIVTAVSGSTLTVASGATKIQVQTTPTTTFRRYAGDSVKFEDAKLGTLSQVQAGDQMRVRGARSDDGSTLAAEEVVSGSFRNLSGTLTAVDPAMGSVTLKDLATKKTVVVKVTSNSQLKVLPAQAGARMATRQSGEPSSAAAGGAHTGAGAGAASGTAPGGSGRMVGANLSQMVARLPAASFDVLHTGDVVMIVASTGQSPADPMTAITLLSGVEPLLSATPAGAAAPTLSPWTTGMPEAPGQ